jgi:isoleucyl-tRNA synthetase
MAQIKIDDNMLLILDTVQTPELFAEGFSREIVRRIQSMRKEMNLDIEDNILTEIAVDKERKQALETWKNYISEETRSKTITFVGKPKGTLVKTWKIAEAEITIGIHK